MKKIYSLMLLAVALVCLPKEVRGETLTVMDDDYYNQYVPINGYGLDAAQHNQFLLLSSELSAMNGNNITGIKFYIDRTGYSWYSSNIPNVTIRFAEIDATSLSSQVTVDESFSQVYSGTISFLFAEKEWSITFDDAYKYKGGNLLIDIQTTAGTYIKKNGSYYMRFYCANVTGRAMQGSSASSYCPKTTFTYELAVSGPSLKVLDGSTKISTGYNYSFGLATAGSTKTFTLSNPGTEATPVAVAHTGSFGAELSAASIPAGGEITLTVTMPATTGDDVITISSEAESIEDFVINVSGTVRDASKVYETLLGGSIPEDWTTSGGTWNWSTTNGASNTALYESSNYRLITPQLIVAEGEKFFFEAQGTYNSYQGVILEYSADGTTWTASGTATTVTSDWQTFEVADIPAGRYYLAFHGWHVNIRNFYGGSVPAMPKDLKATSTTDNSATLSWTPAGSESAWILQYSTDGEHWSADVPVNSNPYVLEGLTSNTKYYIQIKAAAAESEWSKVAEFRTACGAIAALPWSENFESAELNAAPSCWEVVDPNNTKIYVSTGSTWFDLGTTGLFFEGASVNYGYILLPEFEAALNTLQISFSHSEESSSSSGKIEVGYYKDDKFTLLKAFDQSQKAWKAESPVALNTVPAGARLAFGYKTNSSTYAAAIDNITVSVAPSCAIPTGLEASEITTNSAKLSWTGGEESAWKLQTSTDGENWGEAKDITANPYVMEGLNPNTLYYVRVQANCGESQSEWSAACNFRTECTATTISKDNTYSENFDEVATALPACWELLSATSYPKVNNQVLEFYGNYGTVQTAVLPEFTEKANQLRISFQYNNGDYTASRYGQLAVGYVVGEEFTTVTLLDKKDSYTDASVEMPNEAPENARLAIRLNGGTSGWTTVLVNNVTVDFKSVAAPTGLAVEPANEKASISWTNIAEDAAYVLRYRVNGSEGEWKELKDVTSPTVLEGLTNGTAYEVQVKAVVSANREGNWTSPVVVTPQACASVIEVTYGAYSYDSVVVNWTTSGVGTWTLRYQKGELGATVKSGIAGTTYTLKGLETGVPYTIEVKADCGDESTYVAAAAPFTPQYTDPASAEVSNATDSNAVATWAAVADATGYEYIVVAKDAAVNWESARAATEPTAVLKGLSGLSEYDFYVRATYPTGHSNAAKATFATIGYAPKNLAEVGAATLTSAQFSWEANGAATQYQWSTDNSKWSAEQTELSAIVEGLSAGQSYTFYVRSYYAEDKYSEAVSIEFTTACDVYEMPYSEGFESTKPLCWETEDWSESVAAGKWNRDNNYKKSGNYSLRFSASSDAVAEITSPSIHLNDAAELSFYLRNIIGNTSNYVEGKVIIRDGGETPKEVAFDHLGNSSNERLYEQKVDLSDFSGKTITITFQATGASNNKAALYIDDVDIHVKPCDAAQSNLAATSTTEGADITWDTADEGAQFQYCVVAKDAEADWSEAVLLEAGVHAANISGKVFGVQYDFYVRTYCSATRQSEANMITFTPSEATGLESNTGSENAIKRIINDQLIIEKNGKRYNVLGNMVR